METPLYNRTNGKFSSGNLGLWNDKFFDKWNSNFDALQKDDSKKEWIDDVVSKTIHVQSSQKIAKITGVATVCYQTKEPMIIGMGLNHPIENGMLFHHTLGVPYLPGSSIKGLVRAWADEDKEKIKRILGPEDKETSDTQAGSVIFFDALPVNEVKLKRDIMTPHYPDYYSTQGKTPPADNQDPTPIQFLVVAEGAIFQFAFKIRKLENEGDIKIVKDWLKEALENLGAGAKTAVGYGRMTSKDCPEQENRESLWMQENVVAVKKAHHISNDDQAKKSKPLAELWQKIPDEVFKQKVKAHILKCQPSKKALIIYRQ